MKEHHTTHAARPIIALVLLMDFHATAGAQRNEWDHDVERDRSSTVCAGAIMTGTMVSTLPPAFPLMAGQLRCSM
jgi:hypothetical protein